jgi:hypothetical protein
VVVSFERKVRMKEATLLKWTAPSLAGFLLLLCCGAARAGPITITFKDVGERLEVTVDPANATQPPVIDQPSETAKVRGIIPQGLVAPRGAIPRATFAAVVLLEGKGGPVSDVITLDIATIGMREEFDGTIIIVFTTKYLLTLTSDVEGQPALMNPVPDPRHRNELVEDGTEQNISALFVDTLGNQVDTTPAFTVKVSSDPVPAPSSLVLLGTGLAGLLGYGWRARRRVTPWPQVSPGQVQGLP